MSRGAVAVFAKQNAKQRERLSEKQRQYNRSRKSAVATRMRKVCMGGRARCTCEPGFRLCCEDSG